MKTLLVAAAGITLFTGELRAEPTEFVPLRGEQPHREVSQQPQVDRRFVVPVYLSWPDRPYDVIGYICVYKDDWRAPEEANLTKSAAIAAKTRGADAVLVGHMSSDLLELTTGSRKAVLLLGQAIKWAAR